MSKLEMGQFEDGNKLEEEKSSNLKKFEELEEGVASTTLDAKVI